MDDNISGLVDEEQRLEILSAYPLALPGLARKLDRLASAAAIICGCPIGLVSIVGADRQSFIGKAGLEADGTSRDVSFCAHAMLGTDIMVVPDARLDSRFSDNPLVTGEMKIRFYAGVPLVSPEGAPLGSFCIIDTVPRPDGLSPIQHETLWGLAEAALALIDSARREAAAAEIERTSQEAVRESDRRYQLLADAMPQLLWSTNAAGQTDYFNRGWLDYTGAPAERSYGAGWLDFLHPDDREATKECWRSAVKSGEPYEIEYRLLNAEGDYRWMLARGTPLFDNKGGIARWFGSCTDVHESKRNSEHLRTLSRELNHRIKNIFAVVGGLVSLSVRQFPDFAEAGKDLQNRILALGRAHDLVRAENVGLESEEGQSSLLRLIEVILEPYQDTKGERIIVTGTDFAVDDRAATPLSLFFHELATNAAKYGALSTDDGTVTITLSRDEDARLSWRESGGPPVAEAESAGFGANLIQLSIARQLGGTVDYDWRRDGLEVTATIPVAALKR